MKIHIIIERQTHVVLAVFDRWELVLQYTEAIKDRKIDFYIMTQEVLNKLPNWAIKHLEEKYL